MRINSFKLYNNDKGNVIAQIRVTKKHFDGYRYGWDEYTLNVPEIKQIIAGLKNFGFNVDRMTLNYVFCDLDTKYYRRFPDDVTDKLYKIINHNMELAFTIKSNRLHVDIDGYDIVLPKDIRNISNDEILTVSFKISRIDETI